LVDHWNSRRSIFRKDNQRTAPRKNAISAHGLWQQGCAGGIQARDYDAVGNMGSSTIITVRK
jgi:hypothetical protein